MNKRLKKKHLKNSNILRQEKVLKIIEKKFTIENKVFLDGYFIFNMGKCSVCHFQLKETPNWKYGIWLNKKNKFNIFGEHIDLIDKFKPSRTYISCKNDIKKFLETVKNIKENPKLYFVDSLTDGDALVDFKKEKCGDEIWYSGYQVVRKYDEETKFYDKVIQDKSITQEDFVNKNYDEFFKEKEQRKKDEDWDRTYAFDFFKEIPNLKNSIRCVGIFDLNKGGWDCCPRYDIRILVDRNISQEEINNLYNKLEKTIKDKNYSTERKTSEHQFDFNGIYDNLADIKICDYIFKKKGVYYGKNK